MPPFYYRCSQHVECNNIAIRERCGTRILEIVRCSVRAQCRESGKVLSCLIRPAHLLMRTRAVTNERSNSIFNLKKESDLVVDEMCGQRMKLLDGYQWKQLAKIGSYIWIKMKD